MNVEELKDKLVNLFNDEEITGANPGDMMYEDCDEELFESVGITAVAIKRIGGEGEGEDYYTIYHMSEGDANVFVKFYGSYASYYGAEYQGYDFVKPKQKRITVYE